MDFQNKSAKERLNNERGLTHQIDLYTKMFAVSYFRPDNFSKTQ